MELCLEHFPESFGSERCGWFEHHHRILHGYCDLRNHAPLTSAGSADTFTARIVADAPQAPTGASASNAVTPVNTFTMKLLKISARFITTQLNLPGPGKVVQVGTTRLSTPRATEMAKKARTMIVCRARKTVTKAGKVTIICRLTAKARAARKKHSLKVRLVTTGLLRCFRTVDVMGFLMLPRAAVDNCSGRRWVACSRVLSVDDESCRSLRCS